MDILFRPESCKRNKNNLFVTMIFPESSVGSKFFPLREAPIIQHKIDEKSILNGTKHYKLATNMKIMILKRIKHLILTVEK